VFLKLFVRSLWTHRCRHPSLIKQTQGSIFKELNQYIQWSPVQCDRCAWRHSIIFEMLGDILVGYSRKSLAYESTSDFFALRELRSYPKLTQWSINGSVWALSLPSYCLLPLSCFPPCPSKSPQGGDSAHFENHWLKPWRPISRISVK